MHSRLTVAVLAFLLAAGREIPSNRRALDEAATFLTNCARVDGIARSGGCSQDQQAFMLDYLKALAGSTLSMKNLAEDFQRPHHAANVVSKVRSCAWSFVAQFRGSAPEDGSSLDGVVDKYCAGLSENDFEAAKVYATRLNDEASGARIRVPRRVSGEPFPGSACDTFSPQLAAQGRFGDPKCDADGHPITNLHH